MPGSLGASGTVPAPSPTSHIGNCGFSSTLAIVTVPETGLGGNVHIVGRGVVRVVRMNQMLITIPFIEHLPYFRLVLGTRKAFPLCSQLFQVL